MATDREAAFRGAFERSLDGMLITNDEGCYVDANPAACELLGRSREEILSMKFGELSVQAQPALDERWRDFLAAGTAAGEWPLRRPDGELRILQYMSVARIAPGQNLSIVRDVTRERRAQEELRRSEEMFARSFHASPVPLAIAAIPCREILDINEAALRLVGWTRDEVIGRNGADLGLWGDESERGRLAAEWAAHGAVRGFHARIRHRSGEPLDVVMSIENLEVRGQTCVLTVVVDITAQRTAERKLDETKDRLAAIVQSSRDAITSTDLESRIETWNAAAERLFGYTSGEMIGRRCEELVPPDRLDTYRRTFAQVLKGEVAVTETVRVQKGGGLVEVSESISPVVDASGRVVGASTVTRDITAQRKLQASLREAEERLHHIQKMEAIGALAGGIAHDFNNILSVILTCSTMVEQSLRSDTPRSAAHLGTIVDDARAIREAAERAATLTRQLLAFSRRQVLAPQVVDIARVIASTEAMLRRLVGERITLVTSAEACGNALIDPSQLEQVILNLVVNARDAMPDGGRLTIDSESVAVDDALVAGTGARPGPYIRIRVADTGIGMDEKTRARMFEPFFTTKEQRGGTGLGLATVFGIVQQSGGFARVESERGRGTTIEVYVPRSDRMTEPEVTSVAPEVTRGVETILLVEDDDQVRKQVHQLLRREGYQVLVAANAGEALLISEQQPEIDLLLTDVVMPIMNGRQLAERLRVHAPELPVVYMSGYHDDEVLRGMLGSPDVVYLQKPVRTELLLLEVRGLLTRR